MFLSLGVDQQVPLTVMLVGESLQVVDALFRVAVPSSGPILVVLEATVADYNIKKDPTSCVTRCRIKDTVLWFERCFSLEMKNKCKCRTFSMKQTQ